MKLPPHGEALLLLRVAMRLTVEDAARLLKFSPEELKALERDKTCPLDVTQLGKAAVCFLRPTVEEIAAGRSAQLLAEVKPLKSGLRLVEDKKP